MKLSTRSRYGIRMLVEIASAPEGKPVMLRQIASSQDLSLKYLSKLVILLKSAGIVSSIRGANGGYVLAKPPSKINMKDLILILEGDIFSVECAADSSRCKRTAICPMKEIWEGIEMKLFNILENITMDKILDAYREKKSCNAVDFSI